jgi:hypothetical protein
VRATSPVNADELDARRVALEGPRAAAFGQGYVAPAAAAAVRLDLQGLAASDELELDGERRPINARQVTLTPGLHHARVWRGGRPIFATFAPVVAAQTVLTLDVPALVPCSAEDLERVPRFSPTRADEPAAAPPGIACSAWARVREDRAGIAISLCQRSHCGAFQHWQRREPLAFAPIAVERRAFPAWAGFALAGGAAVIASSIVLWQSGAFERGRASTATWEYGGLNPQGIRF